MHKIIERRRLVPNIHLLRVEAPEIVKRVQPGNFVVVKIDEKAERVPLTVADWDVDTGVLSIVVMTVGASTHRLARLNAGDEIEACVGPLGRTADIAKVGTVAVVMGCYGIGAILPVARALKKAGNRVIAIMEARTKELLYWVDKHQDYADEIHLTTFDGSRGDTGRVSDVVDRILKDGTKIDRAVVQGCTFMMMKSCEATRPHQIKTTVSLNPVMIDGTGMCGVCRCSIAGKTKFACVDGPDFDGHEVDWKELVSRRRSYLDEEVRSLSEYECRSC
ncbi:MAG: sulfide/dihydroorotate dehydrogenase-like FAD/NAD-binding protein [Elusimicrobiota bacterium]